LYMMSKGFCPKMKLMDGYEEFEDVFIAIHSI
jgi:hypothetical protein